MRGDVNRRVTYFLRSRKGWYLEEKAWRRKAGQQRVEAESLFEDARCDTAAFSAGEAQRVEEGHGALGAGCKCSDLTSGDTFNGRPADMPESLASLPARNPSSEGCAFGAELLPVGPQPF